MEHAGHADRMESVAAAEPLVIQGTRGPAASASFTRGAENAIWKTLPVVLVPGSTSRDLGGDVSAEIDVAIRAWTTLPCTAFRARVGAAESRAPANDGRNVVYFHEDGWPAWLQARALAQTVIHTDAAGNATDADIHVNATDHRWSLDGRAGTADARAVLIHEIGHLLGLGHSADPRATMFASGAGPAWRSLEADDRLGACTLYPGTGEAGCDLLPCPAPHVCVANRCQRPGDARDVCSPCDRVPGACAAAGDEARCVDLARGRVCGRGCDSSADCGRGFTCRHTTESGDLQCVSDDACRTGANRCADDSSCAPGARCREGACVGPLDVQPGDAGAGVPDATAGGPITEPRGGCRIASATQAGRGGAGSWAAALALAGWLSWRRSRPCPSPARAPASRASSRRGPRSCRPTSS